MNKKIIGLLLAALVLSGAVFALYHAELLAQQTTSDYKKPEKIILGAPRTENHLLGIASKLIYRQLFSRLGIDFEYSSCSPGKCARYVSSGLLDGELLRTEEYGHFYPELIRVEESVLNLNIALYSVSINEPLQSWNDLKETAYKIGYIKDYLLIEQRIKRLKLEDNAVPLRHWLQGLHELSLGNIDIYVGLDTTVDNELRGKHSKIKKLAILENIEFYPYLATKHKQLAPLMEKVIRDMREDGSLQKIFASLE